MVHHHRFKRMKTFCSSPQSLARPLNRQERFKNTGWKLGFNVTDHIVIEPITVKLTLLLLKDDETNETASLQSLVVEQNKPVTLVTSFGVTDTMLISGSVTFEKPQTQNTVLVTVTFEELRVAFTQTTDVTIPLIPDSAIPGDTYWSKRHKR